MGDNHCHVTEVKSWRANVEDGDDRERASDTNKVKTTAEHHNKPDRVDRRPGILVDLAPEATANQQMSALFVPGEAYLENGRASSRANA